MSIFKKYKVKSFIGGNIEPHEVFLDKLAHNKEDEWGITEKKFEVALKPQIFYIFFIVFLLCALALFSRAFSFQVLQGKNLYSQANRNKGGLALIKSERGIIYDKNMQKLVVNSPAYDFVCDKINFPSSSEEIISEINDIAIVTGRNPEELKKLFESSEDSLVLVYKNISHEMLLILSSRINDFKGCFIEKNTAREYVFGQSFSHLLGYISKIDKKEFQSFEGYGINDYVGKSGIEKSYEGALRGTPGIVKIEKNATGFERGLSILSEPEPGGNLVLNIDADLQKKLYEELEKSITNIGSKKGAAVAINPSTGAVLALVSYPSYDDNLFAKGISQTDFDFIQNNPDQPMFNRAVSAQYPTGSTIKPFEAAAALQEKTISPNKKIYDPGYIEVRSKYDSTVVYRFGGVIPHGWVAMRDAIAVSSNIYFYTVGGGYGDQQGLGPTRIKKYLSLFGWGEKTGVDLPGEFKGFIPSPEWKKQTKNESWWDGDTYNLSIGQSDLQVTPLQLASAYCVIANNGTLYKPQIVQKIVDASASSLAGKSFPRIISEFKPEIIRQNFIDSAYLQIVREGMRLGVTSSLGSSFMLNDLPVAVASKTGTAEIPEAGHYNTWTAVYGPYENPNIVLVVTIEDVQGLRASTLPVAKEVLRWYFSR
jgi:penicillin-binding protein 2